MASRIGLVVPFRSDGGQRDRIWAWCKERWVSSLGVEAIECDSQDELFHRGRSINEGVSTATSAEILIIADADTMVSQPHDAVAAAEKGLWCIAYGSERYYTLTPTATENLLISGSLREPTEGEWEHRIDSWSGVLVMPRAAFEAVNGFDTQFRGWGWEDRAFQLSLDVLWGAHARVPGFAVHLYHPRGLDFEQPFIEHNRRLYLRYTGAPYQSQMRTLVNNRG